MDPEDDKKAKDDEFDNKNPVLDYYKKYSQNRELPKYFSGTSVPYVPGVINLPEHHTVSQRPGSPIEVKESPVKIEFQTDTEDDRNLSPSSSVASNRKLEWDNGADIGYGNYNLKPNIQKSTSLPLLSDLSEKKIDLKVESSQKVSQNVKIIPIEYESSSKSSTSSHSERNKSDSHTGSSSDGKLNNEKTKIASSSTSTSTVPKTIPSSSSSSIYQCTVKNPTSSSSSCTIAKIIPSSSSSSIYQCTVKHPSSSSSSGNTKYSNFSNTLAALKQKIGSPDAESTPNADVYKSDSDIGDAVPYSATPLLTKSKKVPRKLNDTCKSDDAQNKDLRNSKKIEAKSTFAYKTKQQRLSKVVNLCRTKPLAIECIDLKKKSSDDKKIQTSLNKVSVCCQTDEVQTENDVIIISNPENYVENQSVIYLAHSTGEDSTKTESSQTQTDNVSGNFVSNCNSFEYLYGEEYEPNKQEPQKSNEADPAIATTSGNLKRSRAKSDLTNVSSGSSANKTNSGSSNPSNCPLGEVIYDQQATDLIVDINKSVTLLQKLILSKKYDKATKRYYIKKIMEKMSKSKYLGDSSSTSSELFYPKKTTEATDQPQNTNTNSSGGHPESLIKHSCLKNNVPWFPATANKKNNKKDCVTFEKNRHSEKKLQIKTYQDEILPEIQNKTEFMKKQTETNSSTTSKQRLIPTESSDELKQHRHSQFTLTNNEFHVRHEKLPTTTSSEEYVRKHSRFTITNNKLSSSRAKPSSTSSNDFFSLPQGTESRTETAEIGKQFVGSSESSKTNWRDDKTLSERLLEQGCSIAQGDHVLNYAKNERKYQLSWVNNEISHLNKLKKLLETRPKDKVLKEAIASVYKEAHVDDLIGVQKTTTVYMVSQTDQNSFTSSCSSKLSKQSSKSGTNFVIHTELPVNNCNGKVNFKLLDDGGQQNYICEEVDRKITISQKPSSSTACDLCSYDYCSCAKFVPKQPKLVGGTVYQNNTFPRSKTENKCECPLYSICCNKEVKKIGGKTDIRCVIRIPHIKKNRDHVSCTCHVCNSQENQTQIASSGHSADSDQQHKQREASDAWKPFDQGPQSYKNHSDKKCQCANYIGKDVQSDKKSYKDSAVQGDSRTTNNQYQQNSYTSCDLKSEENRVTKVSGRNTETQQKEIYSYGSNDNQGIQQSYQSYKADKQFGSEGSCEEKEVQTGSKQSKKKSGTQNEDVREECSCNCRGKKLPNRTCNSNYKVIQKPQESSQNDGKCSANKDFAAAQDDWSVINNQSEQKNLQSNNYICCDFKSQDCYCRNMEMQRKESSFGSNVNREQQKSYLSYKLDEQFESEGSWKEKVQAAEVFDQNDRRTINNQSKQNYLQSNSYICGKEVKVTSGSNCNCRNMEMQQNDVYSFGSNVNQQGQKSFQKYKLDNEFQPESDYPRKEVPTAKCYNQNSVTQNNNDLEVCTCKRKKQQNVKKKLQQSNQTDEKSSTTKNFTDQDDLSTINNQSKQKQIQSNNYNCCEEIKVTSSMNCNCRNMEIQQKKHYSFDSNANQEQQNSYQKYSHSQFESSYGGKETQTTKDSNVKQEQQNSYQKYSHSQFESSYGGKEIQTTNGSNQNFMSQNNDAQEVCTCNCRTRTRQQNCTCNCKYSANQKWQDSTQTGEKSSTTKNFADQVSDNRRVINNQSERNSLQQTDEKSSTTKDFADRDDGNTIKSQQKNSQNSYNSLDSESQKSKESRRSSKNNSTTQTNEIQEVCTCNCRERKTEQKCTCSSNCKYNANQEQQELNKSNSKLGNGQTDSKSPVPDTKDTGEGGSRYTESVSTSSSSSTESESSNSCIECVCCKQKKAPKLENLLNEMERSVPLCFTCNFQRKNMPYREAQYNPYGNANHICTCYSVVQTSTLNEIKKTLHELDALEQTEQYCKCNKSRKDKNSKYCKHCKCKLKDFEKNKNGVAYMLTFEVEDKPKKKKNRHKKRQLEEIKIKLPYPPQKKKLKDRENIRIQGTDDQSSENSTPRTNCNAKLMDYLIQNRPNFIQNAEERRKAILQCNSERQENLELKKLLLIKETDNNVKITATKINRYFTAKQMKEITKKNYKKLPEVQQKIIDNREKQLRDANRIIVDQFNQKLRASVLKGTSSLPLDVKVVSLVCTKSQTKK